VELEIIPLALKKIVQRHIPIDWVEQTLNFPDQVVDGYEGRRVAQKVYNIDNKRMLLRVVFESTAIKKVVVTAYFTSQIERYRRKA
jgi:hypothetical protein